MVCVHAHVYVWTLCTFIHTFNFQLGLDLVSQKEKSSKGLKCIVCTLYTVHVCIQRGWLGIAINLVATPHPLTSCWKFLCHLSAFPQQQPGGGRPSSSDVVWPLSQPFSSLDWTEWGRARMRNNAAGDGGCGAVWRGPHACVCACVYVFVCVGEGIYSRFAHICVWEVAWCVGFTLEGGEGTFGPPLKASHSLLEVYSITAN